MKRHTVTLLTTLFSLLASAAVPLRWTVETSRLQPVVFDVVRGETIDLEAAFQSYGTPVSTSNMTAFLCWQTNGMANAWWITNAVTSATRARVLFTPEMDPGASVVHAFLGLSDSTNSNNQIIPNSNNFRAAFTLRFRPGPGAAPNVIDQPPKVLDLARTVVVNPPWPTKADFAATTTVMRAELKTYVDGQIQGAGVVTPTVSTNIAGSVTSNVVTKAYVEDLGIESGLDTNSVQSIIKRNVDTNYLCTVASAQEMRDTRLPATYYPTGPGYWSVNVDTFFNGIFIFQSIGDSLISINNYPGKVDFDTWEVIRGRNNSGEDFITIPQYLASGYWNTADDRFAKLSDVPSTNGLASASSVASNSEAIASHTSQLSQMSQNKADKSNTYRKTETDAKIAPVSAKADEANAWSAGVFSYMQANTNAWFSGTNYTFGAEATNKTHFAFETGMDLLSMPCSMALMENRDGSKNAVWDQRDWTAWYWNFKASQMRAEIAASNAVIRAEIASTNNHAWAGYYAASGRRNPDRSTTYVDTTRVCLSPGMNWETVAEVSGCGYWTIVGNGAVIGGSGTNAVLQIKDFEGNEVMTITKGSHELAWLDSNDLTGQMTDGNGWVCFDMRADAQPVGYFSTTLDDDDFTAETDPGCPSQYSWENLGGGEWRVHFLLKPGIVSNVCFAKFQVEVQRQTRIQYNAGLVIQGGLIVNGTKIAPQIPSGASVGDTVTWKVVQ